MRRKAGIAVGLCTALVLTGAAGALAWRTYGNDEGRPVGTWQDAPGVPQKPVANAGPAAPGGTTAQAAPAKAAAQEAADEAAKEAATPHGSAGAAGRKPVVESATESATEAAAQGRQKIGELVSVSKLLGTLGGPQKETFRYPGASYVKVHFNRMTMLPGDYVTVSNADGTESYRMDPPAALTGAVDRWAMSVTGDTAVVEVRRAAPLGLGGLLGNLGVNVDQVAKGFTRTEQAAAPRDELVPPGRTGREESVCGRDESSDAVCYRSSDPVAYTRSKAVARLLINGTELCTSWRIGKNNRMLTNNHCFATSDDAWNTEVWFNYQCAQCGGYDVFKPTKVWGSKVLATDKTYDFTLFTVEDFPAIQKFGQLELDPVRPVKGQELYVPQHPAGEPTRIAGSLGDPAGTCQVVDNAYDGYAVDSDVSYYCDTAGGSSGSPVLSRKTNKVVALHHFGGCPNSGVRADILYTKLKSLL